MIIDKLPSLDSDDSTPLEAPPSYTYDALGAHEALTTVQGASTSKSSLFRSPLSPVSKSPSSSSTSPKGKGKANPWFKFSASRTSREIRTTVLGLLRDLVRQQHHAAGGASLSILESCAEACAGHSLSLSTLLQEKSIENHTPLYWAIVKRPPDSESAVPDLLTSLISFASPLTPATISEIRHACLLTSDQLLFQRLRMSPEFAPLSGTDEMLLGGSIPPDNITVEDVPGDEGSFAATFEIVHFQKRMLVSKHIELDFIARGAFSDHRHANTTQRLQYAARMWQLRFFIAQDNRYDRIREGPQPGSWCISLSLLENSPPTCIDSRLIIPEPISSSSSAESPSTPSSASLLERAKTKWKPKPTISIRLKSTQQLIAPPLGRHHRHHHQTTSVIVSFESNMMASSLQYTYVCLSMFVRIANVLQKRDLLHCF